jgi:signal peptidase I
VSDASAPPPPVAPPAPSRRRRLWIGIVLAVTIPVALVAVVGSLALQLTGWWPYNAPSGSMQPTLLVGDHFFVDREAYADGRQPRRGDIVVFRVPASAGDLARMYRPGTVLVKRIVGLPGEQVALHLGAPMIDGHAVVQEKLGEVPYGQAAESRMASRLRERYADGTTFEVLKYARPGLSDEGGPFTVPAGSYFVLGDNRDDSLDSRHGHPLGVSWWFVPADHLIGRANYIYWSGFDRLGRIGMALK